MNCKGMIKYLSVALLLCSCTENELQLREREQQFVIRFSTANVCTEVVTRTASPLTGGTMLRILAFRRIGESPDLSMDRYMGEGTYRAINGSGVLEPVSSLLLRTGTYDFYALTPDCSGTWDGLCYFTDRRANGQ